MGAQTYLAYDYPLLSVFWSMFVFFLWIMWFILLFRVVVDIFRDDAMSGWAKTGWLVLTVLLPFLGVFIYVIARGKNMGRREIAQARAQQADFDAYIRQAAGATPGTGSVDELARLADIRDRGAIGRGVPQGEGTGSDGPRPVPAPGRRDSSQLRTLSRRPTTRDEAAV